MPGASQVLVVDLVEKNRTHQMVFVPNCDFRPGVPGYRTITLEGVAPSYASWYLISAVFGVRQENRYAPLACSYCYAVSKPPARETLALYDSFTEKGVVHLLRLLLVDNKPTLGRGLLPGETSMESIGGRRLHLEICNEVPCRQHDWRHRC